MFNRRLFATARKPTIDLGIAFDIDGVLIKGKTVLPQAQRVIKTLYNARIPYIFLTNGGGVSEQTKAHELTTKLGIEIDPIQVVLSHSPMKSLALKYGDVPVLILGGRDSIKNVALDYGFKKPVLASEIVNSDPSIWPFTDISHQISTLVDLKEEAFKAIIMMHDSRDWGRDIQLSIDLLRSDGGKIGTLAKKDQLKQSVPIYFSNQDLIWSNEHPTNRFAQGAFNETLKHIYSLMSGGKTLEFTSFGKPMTNTYEFAASSLQQFANKICPNKSNIKRRIVYAIGDNPASDIAGANSHNWHSILVKTGVWNETEHGHGHGAKAVVEDVEHALDYILSKEGMTV